MDDEFHAELIRVAADAAATGCCLDGHTLPLHENIDETCELLPYFIKHLLPAFFCTRIPDVEEYSIAFDLLRRERNIHFMQDFLDQ